MKKEQPPFLVSEHPEKCKVELLVASEDMSEFICYTFLCESILISTNQRLCFLPSKRYVPSLDQNLIQGLIEIGREKMPLVPEKCQISMNDFVPRCPKTRAF